MYKLRIAVIFITSLMGYESSCLADGNGFLSDTVRFRANDLSLKVEIAANEKQRETGLMFRQALAADQGMLFVFEEQSSIHVWMKNTLIPLDVIFIDQTGKIVSMLKNLPPCKQTNCPVYHSAAPASFMLEVNAGFIEQQQIQPGQAIKLPF